jgi:hypothetical protein
VITIAELTSAPFFLSLFGGQRLGQPNSNVRTEALRGDRMGQRSIRISDHFRVCFAWTFGTLRTYSELVSPPVELLQAMRDLEQSDDFEALPDSSR